MYKGTAMFKGCPGWKPNEPTTCSCDQMHPQVFIGCKRGCSTHEDPLLRVYVNELCGCDSALGLARNMVQLHHWSVARGL